ncbi:response regulator transcription factor [Paenibacillus sp. CAU 1782]
MIHAIVVDDEKLVRKGFIALADWPTYGIEIVGEAGNGNRALQIMDQQPIDLMFVDITMPGINGFELMKKVQQKNDDVQFVILTCHHEFNYVQEALRLGAIDYIVKTLLNKDNVDETMNRISGRLNRQSGRRAAESKHFHGATVFRNRDKKRSLAEVRGLLPEGTVLQQLTPRLSLCYPGGGAPLPDAEELRENLHHDWEVVGIAPCDNHSRQEAEELIRERLEYFLFYAESPLPSPLALKELDQLYGNQDAEGDKEAFLAEWQQFKWLLYGKDWSAWNEKVALLRPDPSLLIGMMKDLYNNWSSYMEWSPEERVRLEADMHPHTWSDMAQTLSEMALVVQRRLADLSLSREVVLCLVKALQEMRLHACDNLTQSDIAAKVNMSRSYFSQCFKLFVGNSFGEVLRKMRIDQAKHLLLESSLSISEIAGAIGFDDNKHFSRTFRERVGMYPTEYRTIHQVIEVNAE